jgi:hypothetical protein
VNEYPRALTDAERAELARLSRLVRTRPVWFAVPLTILFWPIAVLTVIKGRYPDPMGMLVFGFLGVMTVYWEWQVVWGKRLSLNLLRDLEAGSLGVSLDGDRELLPVSKMEWTAGGQPAPWRGHPPAVPPQ